MEIKLNGWNPDTREPNAEERSSMSGYHNDDCDCDRCKSLLIKTLREELAEVKAGNMKLRNQNCNHENTNTHLNYMGTDWVCSKCGKEIMGDEE